MPDIETIVQDAVERRMRALAESDRNFRELQLKKLLALVGRNKDTEFGRAHGFESIRSVADFQKAVPLSTATDYHDAWRRIGEGERRVLFADPVDVFAISSGTTAEPKRIPLTRATVRGLRRAAGNATRAYIAREKSYSLLRGYGMQVSAPAELERTEHGVPVGYITGIISSAQTYPLHNIGLPTRDELNIADWGEKYALMASKYRDYDVRMFFGVTSYVAGFIEFLQERTGHKDLRSFWPNAELVVTSGIPLKNYRGVFEEAFPGIRFAELYLATEAALGFQADAGGAMSPMLEDHFYEFVPVDSWGVDDAPRLAMHEVEAGKDYVLVVTTPSGLYAYSPGDIVRFTQTDPPRIEIMRRLSAMLDLASEKMDGHQAAHVIEKTGLAVRQFTVCPAAGYCAHEWVIEFKGAVPGDAAQRIDETLIAANPSYGHLRWGNRLMKAPTVTAVQPGTFDAALLQRPGQGKILRVYRDRLLRDELVELSHELHN
ncbi:MAG: GH3 auxin-responsive promoter family protein [Planctomycetota bacterium]